MLDSTDLDFRPSVLGGIIHPVEAVVGFDDADIASACQIPLTTVRQPSKLIATAVLRTLLARIARPQDDPREIHLSAPLVIRASTMASGSLV